MIKWRGERGRGGKRERWRRDRETEGKKREMGGRKRNEELCDYKSKNRDEYKTISE